jgi:hypothetical protein
MTEVTYEYLKRWLSSEEIRRIREGENPEGKVLSRQQVYNIMKGTSKNNSFRNILIRRAKENEALNSLNT